MARMESMMRRSIGAEYLEELESEAAATRRCLERVPERLFEWKPHPKSMTMGNLAMVLSEIPRWIDEMLGKSEIDFANYKMAKIKTTKDLLKNFDNNMAAAKKALKNAADAELEETFSLKDKGALLSSSTKKQSVMSTINHLAHHRGQLTVYMRLNDIAVPSIYGPSADEIKW